MKAMAIVVTSGYGGGGLVKAAAIVLPSRNGGGLVRISVLIFGEGSFITLKR